METRKILIGLSLPALIFGLGLLVSAFYQFLVFPGSVTEKLNNAVAMYLALGSFGVISMATILASKGGFTGSNVIRAIYKYSISAASVFISILLLWSAWIFVTHGISNA